MRRALYAVTYAALVVAVIGSLIAADWLQAFLLLALLMCSVALALTDAVVRDQAEQVERLQRVIALQRRLP